MFIPDDHLKPTSELSGLFEKDRFADLGVIMIIPDTIHKSKDCWSLLAIIAKYSFPIRE